MSMTIQSEWQLVLDKEESNPFKSQKIIKIPFLKIKYTSYSPIKNPIYQNKNWPRIQPKMTTELPSSTHSHPSDSSPTQLQPSIPHATFSMDSSIVYPPPESKPFLISVYSKTKTLKKKNKMFLLAQTQTPRHQNKDDLVIK